MHVPKGFVQIQLLTCLLQWGQREGRRHGLESLRGDRALGKAQSREVLCTHENHDCNCAHACADVYAHIPTEKSPVENVQKITTCVSLLKGTDVTVHKKPAGTRDKQMGTDDCEYAEREKIGVYTSSVQSFSPVGQVSGTGPVYSALGLCPGQPCATPAASINATPP